MQKVPVMVDNGFVLTERWTHTHTLRACPFTCTLTASGHIPQGHLECVPQDKLLTHQHVHDLKADSVSYSEDRVLFVLFYGGDVSLSWSSSII